MCMSIFSKFTVESLQSQYIIYLNVATHVELFMNTITSWEDMIMQHQVICNSLCNFVPSEEMPETNFVEMQSHQNTKWCRTRSQIMVHSQRLRQRRKPRNKPKCQWNLNLGLKPIQWRIQDFRESWKTAWKWKNFLAEKGARPFSPPPPPPALRSVNTMELQQLQELQHFNIVQSNQEVASKSFWVLSPLEAIFFAE